MQPKRRRFDEPQRRQWLVPWQLGALLFTGLLGACGGVHTPATASTAGSAWDTVDDAGAATFEAADNGAATDSAATDSAAPDSAATDDATANGDGTHDTTIVDGATGEACPNACDDGAPCTLDTCASDGCTHVVAADGSSCDDGDKCTEKNLCAAGLCTAGSAKNCAVTSPCATGSCKSTVGCVSVEKSGPCDDGNPCTKSDTCGFGVCEGTYIGCDDGNDCTDDTCNGATGCSHSTVVDNTPCALKKVCIIGTCVASGTLYAHTSSTLYKLVLKTKSFNVVGTFAFDKSAGSVTDIALDRGSTLYAVTFNDLFVCKSTTAKCTWMMKLPTSFNGLTFVHKGTIYPNHDALIGIANDGGWWHVDYQKSKLTKLGSYGAGYKSSGDAFSVLGVGTFATVRKLGMSGDVLVRVDPKTGKVLKDFGPIGASGLWGFAWWDGVFYGFGSNGQVWDVDVGTGKGKPVTGFNIPKAAWWGAGVSTEAGP